MQTFSFRKVGQRPGFRPLRFEAHSPSLCRGSTSESSSSPIDWLLSNGSLLSAASDEVEIGPIDTEAVRDLLVVPARERLRAFLAGARLLAAFLVVAFLVDFLVDLAIFLVDFLPAAFLVDRAFEPALFAAFLVPRLAPDFLADFLAAFLVAMLFSFDCVSTLVMRGSAI